MVSQRHDIITIKEVVVVSSSLLNFSYRLLSKLHVSDTFIPNIYFNLTNESELLEVPPMSGITNINALLELMQVSNSI